eukprot:5328429-Amphidinium_carterae.1
MDSPPPPHTQHHSVTPTAAFHSTVPQLSSAQRHYVGDSSTTPPRPRVTRLSNPLLPTPQSCVLILVQ